MERLGRGPARGTELSPRAIGSVEPRALRALRTLRLAAAATIVARATIAQRGAEEGDEMTVKHGLEMKVSLGSVTTRARGNAVAWHLGAAKRFAHECVALEAKLPDPASADALGHYCLAAVILSVAAMEAYGNELLYAAETDRKKAKKPVHQRRKPRQSEVLANFVVALDDRGKHLDEAAKEYGEACALIEARNGLVHFWPEWKDAKVEHADIAKQLGLGSRFALHPMADPKTAVFPEDYMGAGMTTWAYSTAKAFLEWTAKAAGEDKKFE